MRTGDPTPSEVAKLLGLMYALGFDEWPDERTEARVLKWLRVEENQAQVARRNSYQNGVNHGRKGRKGGSTA